MSGLRRRQQLSLVWFRVRFWSGYAWTMTRANIWGVGIKAACLVSSGVRVFAPAYSPAAAASVLPHWFILVWNGQFFLGSLLGLLGYFGRVPNLEVGGLFMLGGGLLLYGATILISFGLTGISSGLVVLFLGASALIRGWDVWRSARLAARLEREELGEEP